MHFESQRISDTDTLSLIYLPNQARSTVQSYAIFVLLQLCFKNVSSVYQYSQHYPLKENIDLTVITFSTCILKWKGVFYFQMYLVSSNLKENTHLSMIIVFRKTRAEKFIKEHCLPLEILRKRSWPWWLFPAIDKIAFSMITLLENYNKLTIWTINSLSIRTTLITRFLSVTLLLHD